MITQQRFFVKSPLNCDEFHQIYDVLKKDDLQKSVIFLQYWEISSQIKFSKQQLSDIFLINSKFDELIAFSSVKKAFLHHQQICFKPLPNQFSSTNDISEKILSIFKKNQNQTIKVNHGKCFFFKKKISLCSLKKISSYLINSLESFKFDPFKLENDFLNIKDDECQDIAINLENDDKYLQKLHSKLKIKLSFACFKRIALYFQTNHQVLTHNKLKFFEIFWSDHCRHTTFNQIYDFKSMFLSTNNTNNPFEKHLFLQLYRLQKQLPSCQISLLNLSKFVNETISWKNSESNAAKINFPNQKNIVCYFKNETHNHPTEIEPIGGAETCIGGAIRDILAEGAIPFSGLRISGCYKNLLIESKLKEKLNPKLLAKNATYGFSSYANKIGLNSCYVKEYYDDGYLAKHLECGAVVGYKKITNTNCKNNATLIVLLGGKTGADGIGGASGSSQSHNSKTVKYGGGEVQKGDAIMGRNLINFFKNEQDIVQKIEKINDFGAGGCSVAAVELSPSCDIYLDNFPLKNQNLSPWDIFFSESQERMCCLIDKKIYQQIQQKAKKYGINCCIIGKKTPTQKLRIFYKKKSIFEIKTHFLKYINANSNVIVNSYPKFNNTFFEKSQKHNLIDVKNDINNWLQRGLRDYFDETIGCVNKILQYGGNLQLSEEDFSHLKLPIATQLNEQLIITHGFDPRYDKWSCYHVGYFSALEAICKLICTGQNLNDVVVSVQEYFPALDTNQEKLNPFFTLLGYVEITSFFKIPLIGGKDSISGTYLDNKIKITVPNTLISFAIKPCYNVKVAFSHPFPIKDYVICLMHCQINEIGLVNLSEIKKNFTWLSNFINAHSSDGIFAKYIGYPGLIWSLFKSFVSVLKGKLTIYPSNIPFYNPLPGSILVGIPTDIWLKTKKLYPLKKIGEYQFNSDRFKVEIENDKGNLQFSHNEIVNLLFGNMQMLYLTHNPKIFENNIPQLHSKYQLNTISGDIKCLVKFFNKAITIKILCFPGTNCEDDVEQMYHHFQKTYHLKLNIKKIYITFLVFGNQKLQHKIAQQIQNADILFIPGGFSFEDQPFGSGKGIRAFFYLPIIKKTVISEFVKKKKVIAGTCNGFQGILLTKYFLNIDAALIKNSILPHHINFLPTFIIQNNLHTVPVSHGEGKFLPLSKNFNWTSLNIYSKYNLPKSNGKTSLFGNGTYFGIDGIIKENVMVSMSHHERVNPNCFLNTYLATYKDLKNANLLSKTLQYIFNFKMKLNMLQTEGKTKKLYQTSSNAVCCMVFKDDITSKNGKTKNKFVNKGNLCASISAILFRYLSKNHIPNHFISQIKKNELYVKKTQMIPLEVIVRRFAWGSFVTKYGTKKGLKFKQPIVEFSFKNDSANDPQINDDQILSLNLVSKTTLLKIKKTAIQATLLLTNLFEKHNIKLIDIKYEFGLLNKKLLLSDELSPDNMRLLNNQTNLQLDKDKYRETHKSIIQDYQIVYNALSEF